MPSLPNSEGSGSKEVDLEIMESITYITRKTGMGFSELMKIPYAVFLSYLKHNRLMDLQETPQGREYLSQIERLKIIEPDLGSLRQLSGYKQAEGGE